MFRWEVTIVIGVICNRWHKSLSFRCCLWYRSMFISSNIGKEWIAWFGIMGGAHFTYQNSRWPLIEVLGEGSVSVRLVRDWGRDRNRSGTTRIDVTVVLVEEDMICHGWSSTLEVASSTVVREWKLLIVNGCKFQHLMPAETGLQKLWQDGANKSIWLGITLKDNDTSLNWMS